MSKADTLNHTLFAWSKQSGINPIHCTHAEGIYVYENDKRYIDFSSQLMNVNIGHNHPTVNNAIKEQLDKVAYVFPGMSTDPRGQLGKKLAEITPGKLSKTFFCTGGADANENAIMLARLHTGKQKIITKYRSYHGASYGAISAGGDPRKHPFTKNELPGVVHIEDPYCYRCPWGQKPESCNRECVQHLERIIQFEGPENIAAILLEGESGSSGCIKYPYDYWPKVAKLAKKYNILTIADEVMSGFGRCGQWFAINNFNVEPDIMVMAKGISSGYIPLGAVTVTDEIAKTYDNHPLPLGMTYSAHALGCAAALGCIQVYEDENLIEKTAKLGHTLNKRLRQMRDSHHLIGDCRNTGLLGCIELVKDKKTKEHLVPWNAKGADMKISTQLVASLREKGLHTFVRWNWIFIAPPLIISEDELMEGLDIISEAIKRIEI